MVMFELTIYKSSTVIKMYTPQDAVPLKFLTLPEEELTLVYEARDNVLEYLHSLI